MVVGLVRSVYAAAVVDRLVVSSPATRLTLPSAHRERVVPLTVDQVRALAGALAPRYQAMVLVQAGLGLRVGELLGLRVGDVDFLRRTVHVEHQAVQRTRELLPPKTPRSKRRCRSRRWSPTPWPPTWHGSRRVVRSGATVPGRSRAHDPGRG